tara:strand:+ start:219 stop:1598 length:1380 start_codon:yes stop_codon:yes gene_type:complete
MDLIILKTDFLFLLVLAGVVGYVFIVLRDDNLSRTWKKVFQRPLAASAALIFTFYILIAALDSIHFKLTAQDKVGSGEILSVLDIVLWDVKVNVEKTYSAPLAYRSFSKESLQLENGKIVRDYPRLFYGGAHLIDPEKNHHSDLSRLIAMGLISGVALWLGALGILVILLKSSGRGNVARVIIYGESIYPFRSILLTLALVFLLVGLFISLSPHYHILGTDKVGNDVFYQGIKSIRTGVLIGTLTTIVILPFALFLGICAGYFRGWVDDLVQFLYTTLSSIPGVLLIAASALMLEIYMAKHADTYSSLIIRADVRLLALCLILGVTAWTGLCRYLRAETLKLREMDFVNAAKAFGTPARTILARHVTPNVMHIVMIAIVLDFSGLVLAEAALTYIDIGVDQSTESWGNMINGARLELAREPVVWWSLLTAFLFMLVLVLAANIFADAVRDAFDPRIKDR